MTCWAKAERHGPHSSMTDEAIMGRDRGHGSTACRTLHEKTPDRADTEQRNSRVHHMRQALRNYPQPEEARESSTASTKAEWTNRNAVYASRGRAGGDRTKNFDRTALKIRRKWQRTKRAALENN